MKVAIISSLLIIVAQANILNLASTSTVLLEGRAHRRYYPEPPEDWNPFDFADLLKMCNGKG